MDSPTRSTHHPSLGNAKRIVPLGARYTPKAMMEIEKQRSEVSERAANIEKWKEGVPIDVAPSKGPINCATVDYSALRGVVQPMPVHAPTPTVITTIRKASSVLQTIGSKEISDASPTLATTPRNVTPVQQVGDLKPMPVQLLPSTAAIEPRKPSSTRFDDIQAKFNASRKYTFSPFTPGQSLQVVTPLSQDQSVKCEPSARPSYPVTDMYGCSVRMQASKVIGLKELSEIVKGRSGFANVILPNARDQGESLSTFVPANEFSLDPTTPETSGHELTPVSSVNTEIQSFKEIQAGNSGLAHVKADLKPLKPTLPFNTKVEGPGLYSPSPITDSHIMNAIIETKTRQRTPRAANVPLPASSPVVDNNERGIIASLAPCTTDDVNTTVNQQMVIVNTFNIAPTVSPVGFTSRPNGTNLLITIPGQPTRVVRLDRCPPSTPLQDYFYTTIQMDRGATTAKYDIVWIKNSTTGTGGSKVASTEQMALVTADEWEYLAEKAPKKKEVRILFLEKIS